MASPTSPQLRHGLSHRISSFGRSSGKQTLQPLPGEKPAATLRVRVVGCKDIIAADSNGKSDPYVVVRFASQRVKTPVIKKTLNPVYDEKEATFNFPLYPSVVEKIGATIELVLWDKDLIGKDYLGEVSIPLSQWFDLSGARSYEDKKNATFSMDLRSSKSNQNAKGTIQLKIGLVRPDPKGTFDPDAIYKNLVDRSKASGQNVFADGIPTLGVGTVNQKGVIRFGNDKSDGKSAFRINWEGMKLDYSFAWGTNVRGVIMLDIKGASNLPKPKNASGTTDMDPFVAVTYNGNHYRTRVIRDDLNPVWSEYIILYDRKVHGEKPSKKIEFSVLDWENMDSDAHVGDASLDVSELMAPIPTQDPVTGLFPEGHHDRSLRTFKLPLTPGEGVKYETNPILEIRAFYDPHDWLRQRYWHAHLIEHDADGSGTFSQSELVALLKDVQLQIPPKELDRFFTRHGKNPAKDDLNRQETLISLQGWYGNFKRVTASTVEDGASTDEEKEKSPAEVASVETKVSNTPQQTPKEKDVAPSAATNKTSKVGTTKALDEKQAPKEKEISVPIISTSNVPKVEKDSVAAAEAVSKSKPSETNGSTLSPGSAQSPAPPSPKSPANHPHHAHPADHHKHSVAHVFHAPTEQESAAREVAAGDPVLNAAPSIVTGIISQRSGHPTSTHPSSSPPADTRTVVEAAVPVAPPTQKLKPESPRDVSAESKASDLQKGQKASPVVEATKPTIRPIPIPPRPRRITKIYGGKRDEQRKLNAKKRRSEVPKLKKKAKRNLRRH